MLIVPIRTRSAGDLAVCVAILRRVHAASSYPVRWPADPVGWLSPEGLIAAWVAEHDGVVLGHAGLARGVPAGCPLEAAGRDARAVASVTRLFVDPAARRAGRARELLETAAACAVASDLQPVLDVVEDAQAAIALYERSGWRLVGTGSATWSTPAGVTPKLRYYVL
jgi:GNAT superfamily N-acetyltransferase